MADVVPVLAVIGRPNVGKSTLVNRIIGRREAVVEDVPGVTRDRVSYDAVWNGRALIIAFNKWDLVDEERRYYLEREIERELVQVPWAPTINITARTGWHVDRLVRALDAALEGWETRVTTGALNAFLGRLVAEHPHPVRGGKQPKIMFGTQASTSPPTFVLFTSGKLEASYMRFIERRLREEFGFVGSPIHLQQRPRKKRERR